MPLTTGTKLGPYEIIGAIGAGGMGEVYRAHDPRLGRDVAIKVLPDGTTADPEQRARFERETRAVAALSHPNVLAIFDTGSHEGRLYAVTELLEGETLRDRLHHGPIPVRRAIEWTIQLARGLAAAHAKQLVHRDLKPENIFVLTDGRVKILDFGLARRDLVLQAGHDATETVAAITGAGSVLGTAGYMAPEQVRGGAIDARADLFALGAVLYEMLSGRRAFRRETAAETMTAILHEEVPDLPVDGLGVSPALARIVRHCLEKSVDERSQTARDIVFALEALSESTSTVPSIATAAAGSDARSSASRGRILIALVGTAAALGVAWWFVFVRGGSSEGANVSPPFTLGSATQVTADDGLEIDPALSPDGKLLAYASGRATSMRIFIRPVAGGRTLTLSETGAAFEYRPRFSPDGSQILFLTPDGASVASSLGGTSRRVASGRIGAATWSPDGTHILLSRGGTLSVTSLDGGNERVLATGGFALHSCDWSPRNDWIACASGNLTGVTPGPNFGNVAPSAIAVTPVAGGPITTVAEQTASNLSPAWSSDGRHLYFVSNRDGPRDVYAIDVPERGPIPSIARRVTTGLGLQFVALASKSNQLAYVAYAARANIWSLPVPQGGAVDASSATALTTANQVVESLRVSQDRRWLLYDSTLHLNAEIFRMPIAGGPAERLTTDPANDFAPDLSPDGRLLIYHSWRSGTRDVYLKPLDGGPPQPVVATTAHEAYPLWSPQADAIVFLELERPGNAFGSYPLHIVRRGADGRWSTPVLLREGLAPIGTWLPGGQAVAFAKSGSVEVIPVDGSPLRVVYAPAPNSTDPAARGVAASDDGRTLYFKGQDSEGHAAIWSVPTAGGRPKLLVRFTDPARPSIRADFAAGAGRLFFTLEDRQADIWVAEIKR